VRQLGASIARNGPQGKRSASPGAGCAHVSAHGKENDGDRVRQQAYLRCQRPARHCRRCFSLRYSPAASGVALSGVLAAASGVALSGVLASTGPAASGVALSGVLASSDPPSSDGNTPELAKSHAPA
jgi:hypothetical protein